VRLLRRVLPFMAAALCAAIAYDIWVFYARWSGERQVERARQEQAADSARRELELLGGGGLKILNFYASPPLIRAGQHANLCFGVTGARIVRLDPPAETLHPALSYCFSVAPEKSTEYKLTAADAAGHSASASCLLQVAR
jgi:hypothetical protein